MFEALDISSSGLQAQRTRLTTIADNIANISTTGNAKRPPYQRRFAVFASGRGDDPAKAGVRVAKMELDRAPFRKVYEPGNPLRDAEGYVLHPNVDLAHEFVDALACSRAYEANVTAMEVTKAMMNASLRILA